MHCPKCGYTNPEGQADCQRCGVIFARLRPASELPPAATPLAPSAESRWALLLEFGHVPSRAALGARGALLLALALWGGWLVAAGIESEGAGQELLHLVNLPFHEAGHVFFRPFGPFVTSLGGTLGQLLIPLLCLGVLLVKTRDPFGAAVCGWWFGENFLDIAPYVNDARAGELPLVGGNFGHSAPYGFHDWEYLLTETGLLRYDHLLARLAHATGALLMLLALCWGGYLLLRQWRQPAADAA